MGFEQAALAPLNIGVCAGVMPGTACCAGQPVCLQVKTVPGDELSWLGQDQTCPVCLPAGGICPRVRCCHQPASPNLPCVPVGGHCA